MASADHSTNTGSASPGSPAGSNLETPDMGTAGLAGRGALDIAIVRSLSARSDARGLTRFAIHMSIIVLGAAAVWYSLAHRYWWLLVPALLVEGFAIVTNFAPMHECVHRTAFATPRLNEICGWISGLIGFYNFHYYRYYHTWHHRYTQDPERDPELMTPKPRNRWEWFKEISGWSFWTYRPTIYFKLATGRMDRFAFIPPSGRKKVQISTAIQFSIYLIGIALCFVGYPYFFWFWLLPAMVAQPLLRLMLIVEHTGCTTDENGLTNTRTTLASFPVRLLMWNMPFHAEHHLYPSIAFHQLPQVHRELKAKLAHIAPNYVAANREVLEAVDTGRAYVPPRVPQTPDTQLLSGDRG